MTGASSLAEIPHIRWQISAATIQRLATQTETPQVSSLPPPQIRWHRTLAIRRAAELSGREVAVLHVVGGGAASPLFCQLIADASDLPVVAGPVEAAAWGNVLVQARALGLAEAASLEAGRQLVRRSVRVHMYDPAHGRAAWDRAIGIVLAGRGC
jgi:glycerol kinase